MDAPESSRCPSCFQTTTTTPCAACGWQPGASNQPPALALGTRLDGRYRIGRVLGHGGFGITYLAWDENLQLRLAIKEYLPRDSATRAPDGMSLTVYSGPAAEQFAYGLERFLEEARALARFDQHPGIVTVKSFFRAHGTGYSVMDFVEGMTLKQYLATQPGGRIAFDQAQRLLLPIMDALRAVHKEGLLHRDLAPDNIYVSRSGRIKLLDFGAARFAAGEHSKSLSVILKTGYAPEEQYRTKGKQGPWTDVYGLAATLYRTITGQVPPDALDRLEQDELIPPSRLGAVITPEQEAVLLKALAVRAADRYASMMEVQQAWRQAQAPVLPPAARREAAPVSPPGAERAGTAVQTRAKGQAGQSRGQTPPIKPRSAQPIENVRIVTVMLVIVGVGLIVTSLGPPSPQTDSYAANTSSHEESIEARPTPAVANNAPESTQGQLLDGRYLDHGNGTLTDILTDLQWMRCSLGQRWNGRTCLGEASTYTWDETKQLPSAFAAAGHAGWRVPTKDELATLVYCSSGQPQLWNATGDFCKGDYERPTIALSAFPNTPTDWYWSSSHYASYSSSAWYVNFSYGSVSSYIKDYAKYVRLVRGGQ